MSCSMHCSRRNRIRPDRAVLALILFAGLLSARPAQKRDYFTELEISDIRDAQEIGFRTEVLLGIATRRLAALGLVESHDADPSEEPGFGGKIARGLIRIFSPDAAAQVSAEEEERARLGNDLSSHTRVDLLRGYYQALEETMDNIDDAYERGRGDVTESLEDLHDFTGEALDLLEAMDVSDDEAVPPEDDLSDTIEDALEDAIEQTRVAHDGAETALKTLH